MRIDYSEPRQSFGASSPGPHGQRKASRPFSASILVMVLLAGFGFVAGFGAGWYFSQQAAKKSFRAAMEQQSLESSPNQPKKQVDPLSQQPPLSQPAAAVPTGQSVQPPQQAAPTGQVPLSFFESLPKGEKQTVLGSGINQKPRTVPASQTPAPPAVKTAPSSPKASEKTVIADGYVVQVAAFATYKEADAAKTKLSGKGYSASISETRLSDKGTWYRVRVGRHLSKEDATEIATRVGGGAKILPDQE